MYNNNRVFNTRYYSTYGDYDSNGVVKCPFTTGPGQTIIKPFLIQDEKNGAFHSSGPNSLPLYEPIHANVSHFSEG